MVSRNLGAENDERASRAAGNAFALALFSGTLILALGQVFLEPLFNLLGTTESLRIHARDYLSTILLAMTSNNLLRAEGKAKVSMMVMLIGVVTNIILDPIFIFVFRMGVAGAAWATITGQFLAFLFASRTTTKRKTCAGNIAHEISRTRSTVVVDFDSQGSVTDWLVQEPFKHELADIMFGDGDLIEACRKIGENLFVLGTYADGKLRDYAEQRAPREPFEASDLFTKLEEKFDVILCDLPPGLGTFEPSRSLRPKLWLLTGW